MYILSSPLSSMMREHHSRWHIKFKLSSSGQLYKPIGQGLTGPGQLLGQTILLLFQCYTCKSSCGRCVYSQNMYHCTAGCAHG